MVIVEAEGAFFRMQDMLKMNHRVSLRDAPQHRHAAG